jgi:hypothetical protein
MNNAFIKKIQKNKGKMNMYLHQPKHFYNLELEFGTMPWKKRAPISSIVEHLPTLTIYKMKIHCCSKLQSSLSCLITLTTKSSQVPTTFENER